MIPKFQSAEHTPFDFVVDVHESSWIGAALSIGGLLGNFIFLTIFDKFGRKIAIYCLAFPHTVSYLYLINFTESESYLQIEICE